MPSCVYRNCANYSMKVNKTQGLTFHSFPTDEIRLLTWIKLIRQQRHEEEWMPSKFSRICSKHFKDADKYTSNKGRTMLRKTAIPVIEECTFNERNNNSPTSLDSVSIPDEIFESPETTAFRRRLSKIETKQKHLIKKNKALNAQNRRLKTKNARLEKVLKDLKDVITKEQVSDVDLKTKVLNLIRNKGKTASFVWKNFLRSKDKLNAKCKICKSIIKCNSGTTIGLKTHLKSKHNITEEQDAPLKNTNDEEKVHYIEIEIGND